MSKLTKSLITTILLLFSISIFSQASPEGNCGGYGISGGKLDISKKDQICRFDNLMDYTYEYFPDRFIYPIGNSGREIDIYKSYEEMISQYPGDKLINEFGLRRLLKAHMILQNPDVVSSKLVRKLDKVVNNIITSLDEGNQKDVAKHTKTLKGEKSGIHHVSSNGYKAYQEELRFAKTVYNKIVAEQRAKEKEKKERIAAIKKEEERKKAIANARDLDGVERTLVLSGETQYINDRAIYYFKDLYDGKLPKGSRLIRTNLKCYDDFGDLRLNDDVKGRLGTTWDGKQNYAVFNLEDNPDFTFRAFVIGNENRYKCTLSNSKIIT